jgi:protein TonB
MSMIQSMLPGRAATVPTAALVTLSLFYAMTVLIRGNDDLDIIDPMTRTTMSFVREIKDEPPPVKPETPKPPKVEKPPQTQRIAPYDPFAIGLDTGQLDPGIDPRFTVNPSLSSVEGDAVPLVTSLPEYPRRAAEKGVEGWVVVEFSIDSLGRVFEPRVVEGRPSGVFDAAALRAIQRYKYKPKVLNGEGVPVSGVRQRILFELEG